MPREAPQRTCISCRKTNDKSRLIRYVLSPEGEIVPDIANKLPGRGVYTCVDMGCARKAVERNLFSRSLKRAAEPQNADKLCAHIVRCMEERISSYIALANKAGKIVSGSDMVMENLRKKTSQGKLALLANDISEDIGLKIRHLADVHGITYYALFDRNRLGELLGKGLRSAIVVQGEGFVVSLIREIERYRNFLRGEGCSL
ncbi:MAG: DUF448 domain-containing protein [Geobacteraceae bacterium]|nr:DUF448 domain-containing protein [Geobacteraceae bacterium]